MKNPRFDSLKMVLAIVSVLLLLFVGLLNLRLDPASAAPMAAPTPVSVTHSGVEPTIINFWKATVLTADTNSIMRDVLGHEKIDLQNVVDQTTTNTITLKLQFSNDGINWIDGPTYGSALTVDTNVMQQYNVFGRYARAVADVTNASPVTVSAIGVAK